MPEISPALYRAGEGEPLVLLHGFTGTWHHWRAVLADLVPRYDVIAPTLAGHDGGPEFDLSGPLTIDAAADHLERHLDDIGVGQAHIAGNSLGGALAIKLAMRGRARSVVALAPGAGWEPGRGEGDRLARFFKRTMMMSRASAPYAGRLMSRPQTRRFAFRDAMCRGELIQPADAAGIIRSVVACRVADAVIDGLQNEERVLIQDGLEDIEVPVLLAWPQFDRVLPMSRHSERFATRIPGAELRVLPGTGHVPMWDNARLVASTIDGWITQQSQPAPSLEAASRNGSS